MTENTTDLVPLLKKGRIALRNGEATLQQVVSGLVAPLPEEAVTLVPSVPRTRVLTDDDRKALAKLPKVFGQVVVEERRVLTGAEIATLHEEREVVKKVTEVLTGRVDVINSNIRHHVDVAAEAEGLVDEDTPRDKDGHYILASKGNPTRVPIPGTNEDFSLEYRSGKDNGVFIDSNDLLDLYDDGKISREDYLALTREVRVFDEDKAAKAVLKDERLLEVIAMAAKPKAPTKPGTSLYVRNTRTK
jgi:hypothetical protein